MYKIEQLYDFKLLNFKHFNNIYFTFIFFTFISFTYNISIVILLFYFFILFFMGALCIHPLYTVLSCAMLKQNMLGSVWYLEGVFFNNLSTLACLSVPSLTFRPHRVFKFDKLMEREEAAAKYQLG